MIHSLSKHIVATTRLYITASTSITSFMWPVCRDPL